MANNDDQLDAWGQEYGDSVLILNDSQEEVWEQYRSDIYKPQFVVIDQELTVVYKGVGPEGVQPSETMVLELLGN